VKIFLKYSLPFKKNRRENEIARKLKWAPCLFDGCWGGSVKYQLITRLILPLGRANFFLEYKNMIEVGLTWLTYHLWYEIENKNLS
jgi:hypothetical protein